jgi:hypothetical protein
LGTPDEYFDDYLVLLLGRYTLYALVKGQYFEGNRTNVFLFHVYLFLQHKSLIFTV